MNRFASAAVVLVVGGMLLGGGTDSAWAQTAGGPATSMPAPAAIPAEARTVPAPDAYRPQIVAFVKGNLARLTSGDPKTSALGRDALISEVTGATTTSSYKDLFAESVAQALTPLLADKDARIRLVAGVLAGKLADKVDNAELGPVAVKLLQDSNVGVQIWGMKTARGVLAYQLTQPAGVAGSTVPAALANVVVANPKQPELVVDAVGALHLDLGALAKLKVPNATVQQLVPHALKILEARIALYKDGVPEGADAVQLMLTFFSNKAWDLLTPAQRLQVMQDTSDLLQLTAAAGASADTASYKAVAQHAVQVGKNLYVIADSVNNAKQSNETKAFREAAKALADVDRATPSALDLNNMAKKIFDTLVLVPEFKSVHSPK